jgi:hypothetical protein
MEASKGQWSGSSNPLSPFLDTDFICFLNLNHGRFFYVVTDRVHVMTVVRPVLFFLVEIDFRDRTLWQLSSLFRLGLICIALFAYPSNCIKLYCP